MHPLQTFETSSSRVYRDSLLQRARRMALRSRAAAACLPCKSRKAKCSDCRPCTRCKKAGGALICIDPLKEKQDEPSCAFRLSAAKNVSDREGTVSSAYQTSLSRPNCFSAYPSFFMPKPPQVVYRSIDTKVIQPEPGRNWEPTAGAPTQEQVCALYAEAKLPIPIPECVHTSLAQPPLSTR
jgi:hypothetical protein